MNRQHINQILNTPSINMYQMALSNRKRRFVYFNPVTSEYVEFDCRLVPNNNHYEMHITNVVELVNSVDTKLHHQNYIKPFRSFILSTLIAGMRRHNNARLILCKSESAAKRYSNLGGVVICIKNPKNGKIWGVVK